MPFNTLKELLSKSQGLANNAKAIVIPDGGPALTYKDLYDSVDKAALDFTQVGSVQPDAIIAIVLPNDLLFLLSFLGVTWARGIASPLNSQYKLEEFVFYLEDTHAKAVVVASSSPQDHPARQAAIKLNIPVWEVSLDANNTMNIAFPNQDARKSDSPQDPTPDDVAMFLHTSGTTSRPKGVPLTHKNLATSVSNIVDTYQLTPRDASLIVMPLFHVHGLVGATLSTLASGGTVVLPPRFSASVFWKQVAEHGVTWYSAVPTIHQVLLMRDEQEAKEHLGKHGGLRFIRSCSSSLAPSVLESMTSRFGCPVLEAYGMTEASHQMASNPLPHQGPAKPGSVGRGTNVQIAILDDKGSPVTSGDRGEVCIRGENVTKGYHNNPEANKANWTEDGWFRTGDQGFLDGEGYLTLTGRIKELINRGGEKISPFEIDNALLEHPKVAEAICFGAPDPKYGEIVYAAVVPRSGEVLVAEEVVAFCKNKLADFKVPQKIFIADSLPRTATGKIQRRFVAAHFLEQAK